MGEVTLRLETDRTTGKKNVIISYRSDESALPIEHEQEHRELVDKLIQGGALKAAQLGKIVVERGETSTATEQAPDVEQQREREATKQGS